MRVVIAVDDEVFGKAIAEFVVNHHWPSTCHFKIVNVVETIGDKQMSLLLPSDVFDDIIKHRNQQAAALVRRIAVHLRDRFHTPEIEEVVLEGHPADEILLCARQWEADAIIVGSHGRGGFKGVLMGSVSSAIVSKAACSVIVIRPSNSGAPGEHPLQKVAPVDMNEATSTLRGSM